MVAIFCMFLVLAAAMMPAATAEGAPFIIGISPVLIIILGVIVCIRLKCKELDEMDAEEREKEERLKNEFLQNDYDYQTNYENEYGYIDFFDRDDKK